MVKFYSIERQDEFAWTLLNDVQNGTFIDMGCAHPIKCSNTYVFYKERGWRGLAFDCLLSQPWSGPFDWNINRPEDKFFNIDIRIPECVEILKNNIPENKIVDYISIDVDMGNDNFGLNAVKHILSANIEFKVMTLEHEYYRVGDQARTSVRDVLLPLGYKMLFADVSHQHEHNPGIHSSSEDWWIHPKYFKEDILKYQREWMWWNDCVELIQGYEI
jgi:hypothetical protein